MIAGPRRPSRVNQSPCLSVCLWPNGLLHPVPLHGWQRRSRRAPSSDGGGDPAQTADPQADPAAAGRGVPGGGEYGRDRSQGGGRDQRLGGQVRTAAPGQRGRASRDRCPQPASGAVPQCSHRCRHAPSSFYHTTHPGGAGAQLRAATPVWLREAELGQRPVSSWAPPGLGDACRLHRGPCANDTPATGPWSSSESGRGRRRSRPTLQVCLGRMPRVASAKRTEYPGTVLRVPSEKANATLFSQTSHRTQICETSYTECNEYCKL